MVFHAGIAHARIVHRHVENNYSNMVHQGYIIIASVAGPFEKRACMVSIALVIVRIIR